MRTAADTVTIVLTLPCHGSPLHAMVAAFGLDERTVTAWLARKWLQRGKYTAPSIIVQKTPISRGARSDDL